MATTHKLFLINNAKIICNRIGIQLIFNSDNTFIVDGKLCLTLEEMLTEVYNREHNH